LSPDDFRKKSLFSLENFLSLPNLPLPQVFTFDEGLGGMFAVRKVKLRAKLKGRVISWLPLNYSFANISCVLASQ